MFPDHCWLAISGSTSSTQVSPYPVILSVENHCGVEQQRVMAQHLHHILGDKLLRSALDGRAPVTLPSPEVSAM